MKTHLEEIGEVISEVSGAWYAGPEAISESAAPRLEQMADDVEVLQGLFCVLLSTEQTIAHEKMQGRSPEWLQENMGIFFREVIPAAAGRDELAAVADRLVEQARADGVALTCDGGLLTGLVQQVLQTALETELTDHLGYEPHAMAGRRSGNSRNGYHPKTVRTEVGDVRLEVPRDRNGSFAPATVPVGQRRLAGLDQAIISLYAKGLTTGDIAAHMEDVTDQRVDRSTISRVTDAIVEDMTAWQSRPLDAVYPVLLVDGIRIKIRDGSVTNRVVYVVMGINLDGDRDILGLWVGPTGGESPKFWLSVMTELRNRGLLDVLVVCCDGLKGLPDAARCELCSNVPFDHDRSSPGAEPGEADQDRAERVL